MQGGDWQKNGLKQCSEKNESKIVIKCDSTICSCICVLQKYTRLNILTSRAAKECIGNVS